jgi:uncharacterized Zn-binding protein involved in type VI secretion
MLNVWAVGAVLKGDMTEAGLNPLLTGAISRASENTVVQHVSCISDEIAQMNAKLTAAAAQGDTMSCGAFNEQC